MTTLIISILILMLLSAVFAAAESALSAANRVRLIGLAEKGSKPARRAIKLLEKFSATITTILVCNNVINIVVASLSTLLFVELFGDSGALISSLVLSVAMLFFCEIVPKAIARDAANRILRLSALPLLWLLVLFTPINYFVQKIDAVIKRAFGRGSDVSVTESELKTIVEEISTQGVLEEAEQRLVKSALDFDEKDAENILIPRVDIVMLPLAASAEEIKQVILTDGHSRIPVFDEGVDDIVGILLAKDFWKEYTEKGAKISVADIMHTPMFILPQTKLSEILAQMQKTKTHIAIVSDERGGIEGLVTLEDILEELVGEIWDEHDEIVSDIVPQPDGSFDVNPLMHTDALFEFFSRPLPPDAAFGDALVSWVVARLEKMPEAGDSFAVDFAHDGQEGAPRPLVFEVTNVSERRIVGLRVREG